MPTPEYQHLYNSTAWRRARLMYLVRYPLCVHCARMGLLTPSTVVDHIQPHRGDPDLFCSQDNWQPLCKQCHDRKTATEDGGYGNKATNKVHSACGADGLPIDPQHPWAKTRTACGSKDRHNEHADLGAPGSV